MAGLWLPDSRLLLPETLHKGRKPVGRVKVNPDHWINGALNCLWFPDACSSQLRDIVGGQDMAPINSPAMEYTDTRFNRGHTGRGHGDGGGSEHYRRTSNNCFRKGKSSISIFAYIKVHNYNPDGSDDPRILSCDVGTSSTQHWWMIGMTKGGYARARIRTTNDATSTVITSTQSIQNGDTLLLVGTFNGSNREIRVFNTGGTKYSAADTATGELYEDKTDSVALLATAEASYNDNYADAGVFFAGTYSDYLTDEQCWSLLRNPYQFLVPESRLIFPVKLGGPDAGAVLESVVNASATAAGTLTSASAELAGDATIAADSSGALDSSINLDGDATGVADATGALDSGIGLGGDATGVANASGALASGIGLGGDATGVADASGALDSGIGLDGDATVVADASGALPLDEGLLSFQDLVRVGAFRFSESYTNTDYARGAIGIDTENNTIFLAGKDTLHTIGEYNIPVISSSLTIADLNIATEVQGQVEVPQRATGDGVDTGNNRVGGLFVLGTGVNKTLIGSAYEFYDFNGQTYTHFITEDPANLATSTISGYHEVVGPARKQNGYMIELSAKWAAIFGKTHLLGQSSGLANISGLSVGPAAYAVNLAEIATGVNPTTETLLEYSTTNTLNPGGESDLYNDSLTNDIWTHLSRVWGGFIVGDSLCFMGGSGGHNDGLGYKETVINPCGGNEPPGYAPHNCDYDFHYWFYDLNDLEDVFNGITQPYDVQPYEHGPFTMPWGLGEESYFMYGGLSFDPAINRIYYAQCRVDTEYFNGVGTIIQVFDVDINNSNLAGDAAGVADSGGELTTEIPIVAASIVTNTMTGSLAVPSGQLIGSVSVITITNGTLTAQISLSGAVINEALVTGVLGGSAQLSGGASVNVLAIADITTDITIEGAVLAQALSTADLTAPTDGLEGSATGVAGAGGILETQIDIIGAPRANATLAGGLTTEIPIKAVNSSVVNVLGGLNTQITFNAMALASALVQGDLTAPDGLSAAVLISALTDAEIITSIQMDVNAVVQALSTGTLEPDPVIPVVKQWESRAPLRDYEVDGQQ